MAEYKKNHQIFCVPPYFRFDASWEAMGCHTSVNGDTKLVRCTCELDFCNAPITDKSHYKTISHAQIIMPKSLMVLFPLLIYYYGN